MTDPDRPGPDEEDPDVGEPVAEIAALAEDPTRGFVDRIRRAIDRRIGAGHVLDFALPAVMAFLREIGTLLFAALDRPRSTPGARDDE
jgi:hypothetical protein